MIRKSTYLGILLVGALLLGGLPSGCQRSEVQRTSLFETAERHFERGEYDAALDDYQAFVDRYPRSPLAETARLRIRSINREVQSMMNRKSGPEARYVGTEGDDDPEAPAPEPASDEPAPDTGPDGD